MLLLAAAEGTSATKFKQGDNDWIEGMATTFTAREEVYAVRRDCEASNRPQQPVFRLAPSHAS